MAFQDILLDEDFDLLIENGDFVIGESVNQDIALIINTWVGHWKKSPLIGVGIQNYLNSSGQSVTIRRNISVGMDADSIIIDDLFVSNNNLDSQGSIIVVGHRNE